MIDANEHLKWLPIKENNEFSISKLVLLALNNTNWPKYLPIETVKDCQSLRTENTMKMTRGETNCFSNQALVFNELPKFVRCSPTVNSFKYDAKNITWIKLLLSLYLCK